MPDSSAEPDLWKGLLAGAVGGLIASFVMGQFSALLMPEESNGDPDKEDSTVKAASAISQMVLHHELTPDEKAVAGPAMHYAFGTTMGAAYGTLVEFWDAARIGGGLPFGAALWLGAHVIAVPALGFSDPITRTPAHTEIVEAAAHLVYGAVAEGIRRRLRAVIK